MMLIWVALLAAAAGFAACAIIALIMARRRRRNVCELFLRAIPKAQTVARPSAAIGDGDLNALADLLANRIEQAGKEQAQLQTIISSMSDGLIALDHQQRILITNAACAQLMDFKIDQSAGRALWDVVPLEGVRQAVTEVSLTGQRKTVSIDGSGNRYLEVTVTRLPLRPTGFIIVARDVTEARRYENLRREFVANVSHELRTPVSIIKGYIETLRDGALDDRDRAMQYLATVERHSEKLALLVNDLLSLSRLEAGENTPAMQPLELGALIERTVELLQGSAQEKNQELVIEPELPALRVNGNAEYLERATGNLIENAIKYTPAGGQIRVGVRSEGKEVVIEIADNGIGIASDEQPRIFERFYRVDRSRSREMGGTGLGLSIVKHVAQTHGGSVEVESTPGKGSVFRIRLPEHQ